MSTDENGVHFYHTCSGFTASTAPDKYIITPYILTDPAKRVKITVEYKIKKCTSRAKSFCKEHFEMLLFKASNRRQAFNLHGLVLAATFNDTSSTSTSTVWTEMQNKRAIKIAFRDQGFCGEVYILKISYLICPGRPENLIKFDEIPAPSKNSTTVTGECVADSHPVLHLTALTLVCFANGTSLTSAVCFCNEGYEKKNASCKGEWRPAEFLYFH